MIVFFKAIVPGGAHATLFATPVHVDGYTTQDGTYVPPHVAMRRKKLTVPKPAEARSVPSASEGQPDLFGSPLSAGSAAPQLDLFAHTPPKAKADPSAQEPAAAAPANPVGESVPKTAIAPPQELTEVEKPEPTKPVEAEPAIKWGVAAGTSKADRRRMNRAAVDLLRDKTDGEMTAEDRQTLARYSGTGGIGDSLNEFYTEPAVAGAMWDMLRNAGFQGGDVLEPSSGTGVFLRTAPAGARCTAVEIDPIAARIAGILHRPAGHEVTAASFERFATQDGRQFDAVIGNVPFGLRGDCIRDDKPDLTSAERYFVDTALDKTKDGGLVALIVPTGVMDGQNGRSFRERVMCKGEFLGAHRLPNTAFEAAHTGVTSDILLFRKRPQAVAGALGTLDQDQLQALKVWDPEFLAGEYFKGGRGASNIMGRLEDGWRAKAGMGHDITVSGSMSGVPEALAKVAPEQTIAASPTMDDVLALLQDNPDARLRAVNAAQRPAYVPAQPGDVRIIEGQRYVLQGDPPRWHRVDEGPPPAVEAAQQLGELLDDLLTGRVKDPALARATVTEALDEWVKQHGVPGRNKDLMAWIAAPHLPAEVGEEAVSHAQRVQGARSQAALLLGAVSQDGTYSDLVTGQSRAQAAADFDTVATKLSLETGGFTAEQLAQEMGASDPQGVLDQLFASPAYAVNADGKTWSTLDSYIGGELWDKLDAANAAAAHAGISPEFKAKYQTQAAALEEAIQPQSLEDVEVMLNSGFVTPRLIEAWYEARQAEWERDNPTSNYDGPGTVKVTFQEGVYTIQAAGAMNRHGYRSLPYGAELLEKYLNRTGIRKDDLDQLERLNGEFRTWLLGSEYRQQVEDHYNRSYRGFRPKAYSETPIAIPGLNPELDVNGYHFAGIRWALEAGKGIIAADVGLGKTGRGLMLAKIAKVTGQAQKPTFVVPKTVLANWMREAEFWFPGSRVLVIGETYTTGKDGKVTSKADNEVTRRQKLQQLRQNDYDFVFISQPAWNEVDLDPITKGQYVNKDFWVQRGDSLGNAGDKRMNAIRTAHDQAIAKRDFAKREGTLDFNDLGIDMLILDEGHGYKNLYAAKNRFGDSPKFLGGSGLSNRALDTNLKTKFLRDSHGGKGVFLLTATPTKNSPLEIYSMLSHVAPEAFTRLGIKNSEDFLDRFCEFKQDMILGVDGKPKEALVTAGFKNLDELREVMRRYIDRKTAEDVGLSLPTRQDHQHLVDMTDEQEAVYGDLREAAAQSGSGDATGDAHIFSIMDKMGKASLDLELLWHSAGPCPKVDAMAQQAAEGAKQGGQVVFCDHVQAHERIAQALARAGIPRERIGIVNAQVATSSAARQKISDDFNAGRLDVVLGNTATMGEGINLQKRTSDIHHLDIPWDPASMQQRNGRGLRQGNTQEGVRIHTYLAKGSFDGYRYQTISAKKDWQDLLWNGGDRVENLAREGGLSRSDMLIMLAANPEAARAEYAANKAEAVARADAEGRAKAGATFARWQEKSVSLAKLTEKGIGDEPAARRLAVQRDRLREILMASKQFHNKDLLHGATPAVVQPDTGDIYHAGVAFEIAGGNKGPVRWSDKPTRWVVTQVDKDGPVGASVRARPYGQPDDGHPATIKLADLASGVSHFGYDQAAEEAEVEKHRTSTTAEVEGKLHAGKLNDMADLPKMSDEALERLGPAIQAHLKRGLRSYKVVSEAGIPWQHPETGEISMQPSYKMHTMIDEGHDIALPTRANRQPMINGYVRDQVGRRLETRTHTSRGRTVESGVAVKYPSGGSEAQYGEPENPWEKVLGNSYGHAAVQEARDAAHAMIHDNVRSAPSFHRAMVAAQAAVSPNYDGIRGHSYPAHIADALRAQAERHGVMDQKLDAALELSKWPAKQERVHPAMLGDHRDKRPWSTVRQFLDSIGPAKDQNQAEAA